MSILLVIMYTCRTAKAPVAQPRCVTDVNITGDVHLSHSQGVSADVNITGDYVH